MLYVWSSNDLLIAKCHLYSNLVSLFPKPEANCIGFGCQCVLPETIHEHAQHFERQLEQTYMSYDGTSFVCLKLRLHFTMTTFFSKISYSNQVYWEQKISCSLFLAFEAFDAMISYITVGP